MAKTAAKAQPYFLNNPQNFRSTKARSPAKGLLPPRFNRSQLRPISLPTTSVTRSWKNYLHENYFPEGASDVVFMVVPATNGVAVFAPAGQH